MTAAHILVVDDEADCYNLPTADLRRRPSRGSDEQQDRNSWQRRIALSAADLGLGLKA